MSKTSCIENIRHYIRLISYIYAYLSNIYEINYIVVTYTYTAIQLVFVFITYRLYNAI